MNTEAYPSPYTSDDDPKVDYVRSSRKGCTYMITSTRYSKLPGGCRTIVDDLVVSSELESFKHWDRNFRRKYYTKAIFMAYEMGKESNEGRFAKFKRFAKQKIDSFVYWFF